MTVNFVKNTRYAKLTTCKDCYEKRAGAKNTKAAFGKGLAGMIQLERGTCDVCGYANGIYQPVSPEQIVFSVAFEAELILGCDLNNKHIFMVDPRNGEIEDLMGQYSDTPYAFLWGYLTSRVRSLVTSEKYWHDVATHVDELPYGANI